MRKFVHGTSVLLGMRITMWVLWIEVSHFTHNNSVPSQCNYFLLFTFISFRNMFRPQAAIIRCLTLTDCYTVLNATHSLHMLHKF
jgi:hypothetical protein